MKKLSLLGLVLMLSLASFAQGPPADHPGGGPPEGVGGGLTPEKIAGIQVKFLTALLDLSLDQQTKATDLFTAAEKTKATKEADIPTQQAALTKAVLANNTGDMKKASDAIGADTAAIALADAQAEAAFNQLLTADQKTKYASLLNGDLGHGHAPGGPSHGHGPNH